jgi:hypothetical protein
MGSIRARFLLTGLILLEGRLLTSFSSLKPSLGGVEARFEEPENPIATLAVPCGPRLFDE